MTRSLSRPPHGQRQAQHAAQQERTFAPDLFGRDGQPRNVSFRERPAGSVQGELIVRLRPDSLQAPLGFMEYLRTRWKGTWVSRVFEKGKAAKTAPLNGWYLVRLSKNANSLEAMREILERPEVVSAEPNYIANVLATPDDPYYVSIGSWGRSFQDLWGLYRIGLSPLGTGSG